MIKRDVGELRATRCIADRKGAPVGRAQPRVDGDSCCARLDPRGTQVKRVDARAAPRSDQQMRSGDPLAVGEAGDNRVSVPLDAGDLDAGAERDPFSGQMAGETRDEFGIVARKHRPDIKHRDPRAQPAMRLRHLDSDRTAADHEQMVRPLAVGENRFIRQIGNVREPGDRRDRGIRPRRDDKAARPDLDLAGSDRGGTREARFAAQDPDPEPLETLDRIVRRDRRDDVLDTVGGGREIDIGSSRENPERRAAPRHSARRAAASSDFEGTQPKLRQSPPISPRSISTTSAPI